jgi:homoserine O-succinyltransferase
MAGRYGDLAALERSRLDGLIVTGAEPVAPSLTDEPYWGALTRVVDWAEHNTVSTIWSCLAAHAAVLHLDGIARRRLPQKRSGLFECVPVAAGGLFDGAPAGLRVPHSRWNDLAEGDLRSHGYRIASRSMEVGIDCFTKQWASLFVFLQGHPEYDADTLYREYRRDAHRYLAGDADRMPAPPSGYFDARTERGVAEFEEWARRCRSSASWDAFPRDWACRRPLLDLWQLSASRLYCNWLALVAAAL